MLCPLETTKATSTNATLVVLSEKDLVHVMELLQSCSDKWSEIGLSLGFTQHELSRISVGAPVSYLQELLSQWVQWPTADHPSHPTLGALCTALRSSLVGLGSLAEELEKEMKQCTTDKKYAPNSKFLLYLIYSIVNFGNIHAWRSNTVLWHNKS